MTDLSKLFNKKIEVYQIPPNLSWNEPELEKKYYKLNKQTPSASLETIEET